MRTGKVSWYDIRDGKGIIIDADGNEYYTSSDVVNETSLKHGDQVTFDFVVISKVWCAQNVSRVK